MAIESLKRIFQITTVKEGREVVISAQGKRKQKPRKQEKKGSGGKVDITV
ncbi:MAG: hypothetical protein WA610_06735 [Thermodesulfovibrionales bacterium]